MQDVPSFLQEVLTVRGQIVYATKDLRAKLDMPKKVADVDDVTLADMDLFVPLSEFSERSQTMHAAHACVRSHRMPWPRIWYNCDIDDRRSTDHHKAEIRLHVGL